MQAIAAMTIRACVLGIDQLEDDDRQGRAKYMEILEKLATELENPVYIVNMGTPPASGQMFYGSSGAPAPVFQPIAPQADELTELALHRADCVDIKANGFDSPVELLSAYKTLKQRHEDLLKAPKMPRPWSAAEIQRTWMNSPELHSCVNSYRGYERIVIAVEKMHGIRTE